MDEPVKPINKEKKCIVFMTCLTRLLSWCHCPDCGSVDICHNVIGSLLVITLSCASCFKKVTWNSQPYIGSTPAGILLSASILLAGATAGKVLRVMKTMALATISSRTYFRHQRSVLLPVVQRVWNMRQIFLLGTFQAEGRDLVLGGDGRADSPGHCATFGSYTMLELHANVVIDLQLVQVGYRECGGSYHMEKTGLERSLAHLERQGLERMVTDRHGKEPSGSERPTPTLSTSMISGMEQKDFPKNCFQ
ncbi:hypothetical protein KUCAC02_015256 [Chaenocephalus aceratus]|uniref:Uncharacterized protein n=1 Tax=Chaenocephalus aceratus TaxID=36190 RepID=A0ACB9XY78_CHAAC|nr:hypothetical protein KUCAC02_015256 [Chaenocephalus aceratus]